MTVALDHDLELWDASIDVDPPPCDWSRLTSTKRPGERIPRMPDDCRAPATWRVQRRVPRCEHGYDFPLALPVNGLLCGAHAAEMRNKLAICSACHCVCEPIHHMIEVLEPIPGGSS